MKSNAALLVVANEGGEEEASEFAVYRLRFLFPHTLTHSDTDSEAAGGEVKTFWVCAG